MGYKSVKKQEVINNKRLFKNFKLADGLPFEDQKSIIKYIDALIAQNKLRKK